MTVIDVPNPERKLKPGMTANVTIEIAPRDDVLRVPNAALRFQRPPSRRRRRRDGRRAGVARRVWTLRDGELQPVRVRTGISDGTATAIVDGDLAGGHAGRHRCWPRRKPARRRSRRASPLIPQRQAQAAIARPAAASRQGARR